jgi:hypothetical protein
MKKPYKYYVICDKTKRVLWFTNTPPLLDELQTWEDTNEPTTKILKQTRTVFIDTRYEAKLRLFNYLNYTKKGLDVPKYKPFYQTEIGKSVPILNF